jgi:hypothetical protein
VPPDQFFFLLDISFRQLRVCYFVATSLTRGRVCNLLFLLALASAVPRDSTPYFTVPILEIPVTCRPMSPYLYPPGTEWPSYTPGHWVPFQSPLTTRRATVEVFYLASAQCLLLAGCLVDLLFYPGEGGSMRLRNVCRLVPQHMALHLIAYTMKTSVLQCNVTIPILSS